MLDLTPAGPDELGIVIELLEQAAVWLHEQGVTDQWSRTVDPDWLAAGISSKETWLARLDGAVVGTITLNWSDPLWTDLGPTDVAGYVHRLTVRRDTRGLGKALLDWAADEVRAHGRELLRLDCVTWNTRLNDYYRATGFTPMSEVATSRKRGGASTHSRYQRYVGERT
ncbi:MAG TPA: GNAT family N-acetyltransferase [Pseudonocardiaceae bacterium]|jgi:GNAT superfamily N-acetyltransferase